MSDSPQRPPSLAKPIAMSALLLIALAVSACVVALTVRDWLGNGLAWSNGASRLLIVRQGELTIQLAGNYHVLGSSIWPGRVLSFPEPRGPLKWWFWDARYLSCEIPTWAVSLLVLAPTCALWYRFLPPACTGIMQWWRARRHPLRCRACGYNLAGIPSTSPCPECGKTRDPPPTPTILPA